MKKEHFRHLVGKYLSGQASDAERRLLKEYYDRLSAKGATRLPAADEQDLGRDILEKILKEEAILKTPVVGLGRRHLKLLKYGVAAAVLILAGGAYFWFAGKKEHGVEIASAAVKQKDVAAPAVARATITLANGQTVVLDTASNGTLAIQGNMKVVKTPDGRIAYNRSFQPQPAAHALLYNTLTNPKGSRVVSITLADGTGVWLNAASSLRYPSAFFGHEREVEITGEAYFEVAHQAAIPFKVKKGDLEVIVLGTHFDVNTYEDEPAMRVTLLEGSVKVCGRGGTGILRPGEQALINEKLKIRDDADLDQEVAWKNGKFSFNGSDIGTVMRQISRWYDVDIHYQDKITNHFTGVISRSVNASQVLRMLEMTGPVHFKIENKSVTVMH